MHRLLPRVPISTRVRLVGVCKSTRYILNLFCCWQLSWPSLNLSLYVIWVFKRAPWGFEAWIRELQEHLRQGPLDHLRPQAVIHLFPPIFRLLAPFLRLLFVIFPPQLALLLRRRGLLFPRLSRLVQLTQFFLSSYNLPECLLQRSSLRRCCPSSIQGRL